MRLSLLLQNIINVSPEMDRDISNLVLDSRLVHRNDLFLAIKGTHLDGRRYLADAIQRGAIAGLVDAEQEGSPIYWEKDIPIIPIYQLGARLGELSARFYQAPAKQLRMIGVTGTNGKTSCTHFMAQALQQLKIPCAVIGTLGNGMIGSLKETGLTTPDAITLQATLRQLVNQGAKAVAMEVSSHSIDQGRVNGIEFDIGMFTNLTQDHLDYHGTMEAYAEVKYRFLSAMPVKHLVINADDIYGAKWIKKLAGHRSLFTYSVKAPAEQQDNLTYATQIQLSLRGIHAMIHSPFGEGELSLPLIGQFNLSNALGVLVALCAYGISFHEALNALSHVKPVPGRMQTLGGQGKPVVVVDYAHTPDALEKALQALRAHVEGRLICVFGCGGDRDPGKRPKMAAVAEQLADQVIVTNDNPRHESPDAIVAQVLQGFTHPERVIVILDRSKAIEKSIQLASEQDCILLAGKGAERYQQLGDEKTPFDDVEQASGYLEWYKQI